MKQLVAIGLNPALQKALVFAELKVGEVNRARELHQVPGGKGYHFARAANTLQPGSCRVAHFLGGDSGHFVKRFHERLGIPQIRVDIEQETRTCTTVLDEATGKMTELIEPSPTITAEQAEQMLSAVREYLPQAHGIGLCGTYPPGIDEQFYAMIAREKGEALLLLDGYRGVQPTLESGQVDILKINLTEGRALTDRQEADDVAACCRELYGVQVVALTDGPDTAWLFSDRGGWRYTLPALERVANPIGAGDTVAGVMLSRMVEGDPAEDAFAMGLAAASASCLQMEGARFTLEQMDDLRQHLVMHPL